MRTRRTQRGFFYLLALYGSSVMALFIVVGLARSMTELRAATRSIDQSRMFHLAEAAIDDAIASLNANPAQPLPFACAPFSIQVADTATCNVTSQPDGTLLITGTGAVTGGQRIIEVVADLETGSIFEWAAFGDEDHVHFHGDGLIDSYDSEEGPYDPAAPKVPDAKVRTNHDDPDDALAFGDRSSGVFEVWGDVTVGPAIIPPDDGIAMGPEDIIHGESSIADGSIALPPINSPARTPSGPKLNFCPADPADRIMDVSQFNPACDPVVDVCYGGIEIPSGCEITIVGDGVVHLDDLELDDPTSSVRLQGDITLLTKKLKLQSGARLHVDSGSTELYVGEAIDMEGGFIINHTQLPKNLTFYVLKDGLTVHLRGEGVDAFYGAIYAPDSEVRMRVDAEIFGSLVANHVNSDQTTTVKLHYDHALSRMSTPAAPLPGGGGVGRLRVRAWRDQ